MSNKIIIYSQNMQQSMHFLESLRLPKEQEFIFLESDHEPSRERIMGTRGLLCIKTGTPFEGKYYEIMEEEIRFCNHTVLLPAIDQ